MKRYTIAELQKMAADPCPECGGAVRFMAFHHDRLDGLEKPQPTRFRIGTLLCACGYSLEAEERSRVEQGGF